MKLLMLALLLAFCASSALAEEASSLKWGDVDAEIPYGSPITLKPVYTMPDLMTFQDGSKVETAEDWERRRAEIKGLYEYYMYGYLPDGSEETLTWRVEGSTLHITVAREEREVTLTVPFGLPEGDAPAGGWPYYIEYSWWGMSEAAQYAMDNGFAAFAYSAYAVAADDSSRGGAFYTLYPYGDHPTTQTGVLTAWAWGVSKIIDALEMGAGEALNINPVNSVVGGVSRFGKSAAVAGAFDERIKVCVPSCSGAGGLGMFRYTSGAKTNDLTSLGYVNEEGTSLWKNGACESFGNIRSASEKHWFNWNFCLTPEAQQLPFDQHFLAALCADPDRHYIIVTGVLSEEWNNVEGQTMAFVGAQPAWDLLGAGSQNNMIVHLNGHAILRSDMELIIDYCKQVMYGIPAERDLSVMKTNVFMEEQNASRLLKQMMGK